MTATQGKSAVTVGRPINGISLNGVEWILDENGDAMRFGSVREAKQFLREHGITDFSGILFEMESENGG